MQTDEQDYLTYAVSLLLQLVEYQGFTPWEGLPDVPVGSIVAALRRMPAEELLGVQFGHGLRIGRRGLLLLEQLHGCLCRDDCRLHEAFLLT